MALNFGLFPHLTADVSDRGALSTSFSENKIHLAVFSGSLDYGYVGNVYDGDSTTFLQMFSTAASTKYILMTLDKLYQDVVCSAYFSAEHPGGIGTVIITLQSSINGTDWTDQAILPLGASVEVFMNWSANINVKYFRLKGVFPGDSQSGRLYELTLYEKK